MSTVLYIKNFLKDKNIGSITSTSRLSVRRLCEKVDFSKKLSIVEYGPGCGVFTEYLLTKISPESRLICIERNVNFYSHLKQRFSDSRLTIVNDIAENVLTVVQQQGIDGVDYVISGLPFTLFTPERKRELIQKTAFVLKPHGKFLTYQYIVPKQPKHRLSKYLREEFKTMHKDISLINIPPMFIYEAIKE